MKFKLDFEQRRQAEQLMYQILSGEARDGGNPEYKNAIFELIALRALTQRLLNASHRALIGLEAGGLEKGPSANGLRPAIEAALECGFAPDWDKALP
jgi:hypothetical protein